MNAALWKDRFSEFLLLRGDSQRTAATYGQEVLHLIAFLQSLSVESLAEVSRAHLEEYRRFLFHHQPPLQMSTQSLRMTA